MTKENSLPILFQIISIPKLTKDANNLFPKTSEFGLLLIELCTNREITT